MSVLQDRAPCVPCGSTTPATFLRNVRTSVDVVWGVDDMVVVMMMTRMVVMNLMIIIIMTFTAAAADVDDDDNNDSSFFSAYIRNVKAIRKVKG